MLALSLWFFAWAPPAPGPEVPISDLVAVDAKASCLDAAFLAEQVATWLDRSTLDPRIRLEAHGDPEDPLYIEFSIQVDGDTIGERQFAPAPVDCAELHAAVGLGMAIALDATVLEPLGIRLAPIEEPPPPSPDPQIPAPPTPPRPPPTPSRPPKGRQTGLGLEVAGGFGTALGPSMASHAELLVDPHPHVEVRVGALFGLGPDLSIGPGSADVWLAGGKAELCGTVSPPSTRLVFCAGGLIGPLGARGRGFDEDETTLVPFGALTLAAGIEVPRNTRVALSFRTELLVPLNRIRLVAGSGPQLATRALPVVVGVYTLGPVIRFR